ncbi:type II toxin-antitoxin system HicB family antitoxin, partial [bacterium]|nr:type II toxin-antitoxin system HicB family antitoxin [bacterium]
MKKHYYGIFAKIKGAIEVEIPDVQGCFTFGKDFDEAYDMAIDALAASLANSEPQFVKNKPSSFEEIAEKYNAKNQIIFPVPVDETILHSYAPK